MAVLKGAAIFASYRVIILLNILKQCMLILRNHNFSVSVNS